MGPAVALAAVALLTLGVYALSLDPDVGFWDTAELQVVPYMLGLAHPTGNPTGILLGWTWAHVLFPIGEPALRANAFSAISMTVAATCGCAIALAYGVRPSIAGASALAFAFAAPTWSHATHADVFDPGIALCTVALLFVVLTVESGRRLLPYAALTAGLALGTHGAVLWYLPAAAALLVWTPRCLGRRVLASCAAIVVAVGAAVYAYLPIRSAIVTAASLDPTRALGLPPGQPFWDWGHPASWPGFYGVVTGSAVRATGSLGAIADVDRWPSDVQFAATQLAEFMPLPLLAAVLALAAFGAICVRNGGALALPLVLVTPFAAAFTAESDVTRYFVFPLLCLWILVAVALERVASSPALVRIPAVAAACAILAFAAYEVNGARGLFAVHGDRLGSTYIADVVKSTPNDAIVAAPWVYATPLGYAAYARGDFGGRIVVALDEHQLIPFVRGWLRGRPVFVVAEQAPMLGVPARLMRPFHVNPDAAHDPKLYELRGP